MDIDVRGLRKRFDLRQVDLAALLRVTQPAVSHWERGKHRPRQATVDRLRTLGLIPQLEEVDGGQK